MFNLSEIVQNAQGGQAIGNLAQQFGISPEQAEAAVKALIPALSMGLTNKAAEPGALGSIIGSLGDSQHQATFSSPEAAQSDAATQKGNDVLGQIFGSNHVVTQIAQQASSVTGLRPDILAQMLPVIASIVAGGLMTSLQKQGFGGLFGQLASAAESGGLGSILGQITGGATPAGGAAAPQAPDGSAGTAQGGLGGLVGSILGGLFGGRGSATPGQPSASPMSGLDPATVQAGMDALTKMFHPGPQAAGNQSLQDAIGQILGGAKR